MRSGKQFLLSTSHDLRLFFGDSFIFFLWLCRHTNALQCSTCIGVELSIIYIKQSLYVAPKLLTSGKSIGIFIFPEPERAPVVHRQLELTIGIVASVARVEELLLACIRLGLFLFLEQTLCMVHTIPYILAIIGILVNRYLVGKVFLKQYIDLTRQSLQGLEISISNRGGPVLKNIGHSCECRRIFFLLFLYAAHAQHICVGEKEVIYIIYRATHFIAIELNLMWSLLPPFVLLQGPSISFCYALHIFLAIHFEPCADNRITYGKAVGKEWCFHVLMDHVQPQGEFTQLNGRGVQVDTIDIVRSDIGFYLLQLITIPIWLYTPILLTLLAELTLLVNKVRFGQLIDDLILECSSTHSRFQNLQFKQFCCFSLVFTNLVYDGFKCVFYRASSKNFRCIVTGRLLTITTIQAIDKSSLG